MKKTLLLALLSLGIASTGQILAPFQSVQKQPKVQLDYSLYSTNAGNGSTTQYPIIPTSLAQMDALFNTANSHTTLIQTGRVNAAKILDWTSPSELSALGLNLPNSGNYFALKIEGTFVPTETGTYTFTLSGDDAFDLSIEGASIISNYNGAPTQNLGTFTGTISLTVGRRYSFIIRHQQAAGGVGLRFYWKTPSQSASIISGYTSNWTQNIQELISTPSMDGSSFVNAAPSAKYIKDNFSQNADGVYWINLPVVGPTQIYCIMNGTVDGGGWMMMMKATTGSTFQYSSSHWTAISTLNTSDNSRNNADAKFNTMNFFAGKDLLALWPDIGVAGGSLNLSAYGCWSWLQNNFNNGVRISPIQFFNAVNRLYLGDASNFSGRTTYFSTQTDVRFYGFNYENTSFATPSSGFRLWTRWGMAYNENGGGIYPNGNEGSPDISGGIGVSSDRLGNYSAGDYIACCATLSGINRTARVEIYIR